MENGWYVLKVVQLRLYIKLKKRSTGNENVCSFYSYDRKTQILETALKTKKNRKKVKYFYAHNHYRF